MKKNLAYTMVLLVVLTACQTQIDNVKSVGSEASQSTQWDTVSAKSVEIQSSQREQGTRVRDIQRYRNLIDTLDFDSLIVTATIVNTRFAISPFGLNTKPRYFINYDSLFGKEYRVSEVEIKSSIDESWIYTFDRIEVGKSVLMFSKSKNGLTHFSRGLIFDSLVCLTNNIKIGMTKESFCMALQSDFKSGNVIKVDCEDKTFNHIFYFLEDTLVAIQLDSNFFE